MNRIFDVVTASAWREVVTVLLHTLWQAPLIAAGAFALLRALPARRTEARYAACVFALALMVMTAAGTWALTTRVKDVSTPLVVAQSAQEPSAAPALTIPSPLAPMHDSAEAPQATRAIEWMTIAGAAWCSGVALMLARMLILLAGARRLTHQASPLDDQNILAMVDRLRQRLRVPQSVRVLVTQRLASPAVVGILRPCIILPASLLSGVPGDQLEAILLHEMAHIRRWDYLVNLAQLFIEALLFFNPAVWWISRQIRIEREACCDAVAVGLTGRPLRYAEALADFMATIRHAGHTPQIAMSMSGGERNPTLDRVSRILLPGYRPRLRLSWPSMIAVLVTSALLLAGVWRGTEAAVTLAADILSPAQRMEKLVAATQSATSMQIRHSDKREDRVKISGTIRTVDGKPLPGRGDITSYVRTTQQNTSAAMGPVKEQFSGTVSPGILHLAIHSVPGYAPKSVGPFTATPGGTIGPIDIVLERGFPAKVKFEDDANAPLPDVAVQWHVQLDGGGNIHSDKADAQGVFPLNDAIDATYTLTATAPGFEVEKRELRFKPDETVIWALKRAAATAGVVLDPAGKPIAGAKISIFSEVAGDEVHAQNWDGYHTLATTDAQGRFSLPSLRRDRTYILLLQTPDQRKALVREVKAGQADLRVQLSPPTVIRGRVTGDLSRLHMQKDKPTVSYSYSYRPSERMSYGGIGASVPVTIEGGVGTFEIHDPLPLLINISAPGAKSVQVDASKPIDEEVVLNVLAEAEVPRREVIVRLITEAGAPPPRGTLLISTSHEKVPPNYSSEPVELKDGQVKFAAYVGGKLTIRPKDLVGVWIAPRGVFDKEDIIPPGESAFIIDIPAIPAGAVTGVITAADGNPPPDNHTLISVYEVHKSPRLSKEQRFNFDDNSKHSVAGNFMLTPLPLNGTYRVKASLGKNYIFSEEIKIDEANPLANIALKFPRGVDIEVKVLDPSGKPMAGAPVDFHYNSPFGGHGFSPTPVTEANGVIRFADINPDAPGSYSVSIPSRRRYQAMKVPVRLDGQPTIIQLEEGLSLKGRVMLEPAGKPLADAKVRATKHPFTGEWQQFDAEGKTNANGEFVFSNLAPGEYDVRADPPHWPGQPYQIPQTKATAGQAEPIEVVIRLVER